MKTILCSALAWLLVHSAANAQNPSAYLQIHCSASGVTNMDSDALGALHNEAVTFMLTNTHARKEMAEAELIQSFNEQFVRFFESKGMGVQVMVNGSLMQILQEEKHSICMQTNRLSVEAKSLACAMQQHMDKMAGGTYDINDFVKQMEEIRVKANELKDDQERLLCGMTASVAKHSALFWSKHADMYYQQFNGILSSTSSGKRGPDSGEAFTYESEIPQQRVRWWAFAASDVYGAWNWGRFGGMGGGLGGVVALGLTGAAWHSGSSLITQAAYNILK